MASSMYKKFEGLENFQRKLDREGNNFTFISYCKMMDEVEQWVNEQVCIWYDCPLVVMKYYKKKGW